MNSHQCQRDGKGVMCPSYRITHDPLQSTGTLAGGPPLVGLEPSCLLALRDEFYSLSLGLDVVQLGKQAFLSEEFLMREGVPAWIVYASCCGMSGCFGLESEHYEASRQMGELALLPAVRAVPAKASIVADGFSCRHQIKDGSGREAIHVAVLLQRALADVA